MGWYGDIKGRRGYEERFEVKRGGVGQFSVFSGVLEWFSFFLRGDWGSLWPKGGAMSHYPT